MGAESGFERRTKTKKRLILETTKKLFLEKGFSGTSIIDIAKAARVSQTSIYAYFQSKDNLLSIITRSHLDSSLDQANEIFDLDIPFHEKIDKFFAREKNENSYVNDESLKKIDWEDSRIQQIYEQFVEERQIPFLIKIIEQGKAEGAIPKDLSTKAVLDFFQANMTVYKDSSFLKKGIEYVKIMKLLFFYGLFGK